MSTFEYIRNEQGVEILTDVTQSTPKNTQDSDDVQQPSEGTSINLTDGSEIIIAATLSAANLDPSSALRTDSSSVIISSDLPISDIVNLQDTLDSKLTNPLPESLDLNKFDILNVNSIQLCETKEGAVDVITLSAPSDVTPYSIKLPNVQGSANTILENDGSGNLSWISGGSGVESALNFSGDNQIITADTISGNKFVQTNSLATITDLGTIRSTNSESQSYRMLESTFGLTGVKLSAPTGLVSDTNYTMPLNVGIANQFLQTNGLTPATLNWVTNSNGNVIGPVSSMDGQIALFMGSTGKILKDSSNLNLDGQGTFRLSGNLYIHKLGTSNFFAGINSGSSIVGAQFNTSVGDGSMKFLVSGFNNTSMGAFSMSKNISGSNNSYFGQDSGEFLTNGNNCAFGHSCMMGAVAGSSCSNNSAFGQLALGVITSGSNNVVMGNLAASSLTEGASNVLIGILSGVNLVTGSNNCFLGDLSGSSHTLNDSNNICIKNVGVLGENNVIRIGNNTHTSLFLKDGLEIDVNNDLISLTAFNIEGRSNTANALRLFTDTGASETIKIENIKGTLSTSIDIESVLGGVSISGAQQVRMISSLNTLDGIFINNTAIDGGIVIDSSGSGGDILLIANDKIELDSSGGVNIIGSNGIRYQEGSGIDYVGIKAPNSVSVSYDITLPDSQGSGALINDGSGITSWSNPLPNNHLDGLRMQYVSVTQIQILPGSAMDSTNSFNLTLSSTTNLTINTTGAAGLQTGSSEASNTWYKVLIIGDTSLVNATNTLLVPEGTAFSQTGYDVFRLVGYVRNNASSNLYSFDTVSNSKDRLFLWNEDTTVTELMTNGSATSFTNINLSELVPPISTLAYINTNHDTNLISDFVTFRKAGLSGTDPSIATRAHRCYVGSTTFHITTNASQNIEYANNSNNEESDLWVLGFTINL